MLAEAGLVVLAKAVLGPAVAPAGKKVVRRVLGDPGVLAFSTVARASLEHALDLELQRYDDLPREQRTQLLDVLDRAVGLAVNPGEIVQLGATELELDARHRAVVDVARQSKELDWDTFAVTLDDEPHRIDESLILRTFLEDLPQRLVRAASVEDSPLHELVTANLLADVCRGVGNVRDLLDDQLQRSMRTASWSEAVARARARQSSAISHRLAAGLIRDTFVPPGALSVWRQHETQSHRRWNLRVGNAIADVDAALGSRVQRSHRVLLNTFRTDGTFNSLRLAIGELPLDDLERAGRLLLAEAQNRTASSREEGRLRAALNHVSWLRSQITSPTYNYTLNLAGSFGSGRTRTLTQIASEATRHGHIVLFVDAAQVRGSFEETVSRIASQAFGRDLNDWSDVLTFVEREAGADDHLLILVDDLDQARGSSIPGGPPTNVSHVVEESTRESRISWVFTAEESRLDAVFQSNPFFWRNCGFVGGGDLDRKTPTGWLDVDRLNIAEGIGFRILRGVAGRDDHALSEIKKDGVAFATEHVVLSSPLAAWVMLEAEQPDVGALGDINRASFVDSYWLALRKQAPSGETTLLESIVTRLGQIFRQSEADADQLIQEFTRRGLAYERVDGLLRWLEYCRIVDRRTIGERLIEAFPVASIEPRLAPFWGYRIALPLVKGAEDHSGRALLQALQPWIGRALAGDGLAESVCQFSLALANPATQGTGGLQLWQLWARNREAPRGPLLMAALNLGPETEQFAVDGLTPTQAARTKRELFCLLRFLGRATLSTWSADRRLALVRPRYEGIAAVGLSSYLQQMLVDVLDNEALVSPANLLDVLVQLDGIERAQSDDFASGLAFEVAQRVFMNDPQDLLDSTAKFLGRVRPRLEESGPNPGRRPVKPKPSTTFAGKFTIRVIQSTIASEGVEGLRLMETLGLAFADKHDIDQATSAFIRREAQTTLGEAYRTRQMDPEFVRSFMDALEQLVDGVFASGVERLRQTEMAFFLIRHSTRTGSLKELRVATRFHGLLRRMAADHEFTARIPEWALPMYAANGIQVAPSLQVGSPRPSSKQPAPKKTKPRSTKNPRQKKRKR